MKIKNIIQKIIIWFFLLFSFWNITNAWIVDFGNWWNPWNSNIDWIEKIEEVSILSNDNWIWEDKLDSGAVNKLVKHILWIVKIILNAILVLMIVYAWINLVFYWWSDDSKLSTWKMQINYSLAWLFFVNIPGTLANILSLDWNWNIDKEWSNFKWDEIQILLNQSKLNWVLDNMLTPFLEVTIWVFATLMIIYAWIQLIYDRWKWEKLEEAKNKIVYSIIALVFVWLLETFERFVFNWNIEDWESIFESLANLWIYFIWPISISAFIYAWYIYITARWDEAQAEKAKNIVINTILWILIVLSSWTILATIDL